jgi:alpha-glucosidase
VLASASLDEDLPIYARAGSIVPMAPVMAWSEERPMDPLTLTVIPDGDGAAVGSLYEDDGRTVNHLEGEWAITVFEARRDGAEQVVTGRRRGDYRPEPRAVEIRVEDGERSWRKTISDAETWEVRRR